MQYFYMTVGLPGSGKTATAKTLSNVVIHSSDAIRAEVLGDENEQTQRDLVFKALHDRVFRDLMAGKNVVYDATNISYKRRMTFLQELDAKCIPGLWTVCVFLATPYEKCLTNNASRERSVPEHVIERMYRKFDVPMPTEGWDQIWIVGDEDRHSELNSLMARLAKFEHDNPHHEYTVGQHCMATQQYLIRHYKQSNVCLLFAALLHDIGKEKTKAFLDYHGNPTETAHFYNHERIGAYESFSYTGHLSEQQRLMVALLIRWHMLPYVVELSDNPIKTANKVRRLVGENIWNQIMVLNDCDRHAH